jgi:hypothetical protein
MTTESFSSGEMILRAKESLFLAKEEMLQRTDEDVIERSRSTGGVNFSMEEAQSDEHPGESISTTSAPRRVVTPEATQSTTSRRVASRTPDHLVAAPRNSTVTPGPIPPSPVNSGTVTANGRGMRIVGNLLLGFVAVIWLLLLIGMIDNPDDVGETLGGGAVMTLVPFLFGVVLRRAGKRRGIAA